MMMNQRSEMITAMENLRTDLYQDTIVFENRAIRELGTGVLTPDLTNLIITIFSNKVALILIDCMKQGIKLDGNQIVNTLLNSNQSPVMLNILQQNQLLGTVVNNGNIMFSQLVQKAEAMAKQNIQKANERNYMQQGIGNAYGNNMYVQQQPINPYANTLGSGILQPTQPLYDGNNLMNTNRPSARYDKSSNTNKVTEFASFYNDTTPAPATNKYATRAPITPVVNTPVVQNTGWLCATGVSINANGEAVGEDTFDTEFIINPSKIEGTYKLTDLISLALVGSEAMVTDTVCKVDVEENIKKFAPIGEMNEDLFVKHWTLKANLAMNAVINLYVDNIVNDIDEAKTIIKNNVTVIKNRETTYSILNKTVREAYVVHSPDLYDNIKSHGLSVDNVIRLSQYSHRTVYNLVQELSNEQECAFVNLFVISSKGIIEVMFFNRGKDTDMCMTLMKQKSI